MRTAFLWMSVCLASVVAGVPHSAPLPLPLPALPPRQNVQPVQAERIIRLHVEYDDAFAAGHGDGVEAFIREAIAIHNVEWRRYRREWFQLERLTLRPSAPDRDASYTLASSFTGRRKRRTRST